MDERRAIRSPSAGRARAGGWSRWGARLVAGTAFWLAIALPLYYVPLLLVGTDLPWSVLDIVGLLGLNVVALVVGHRHNGRSIGSDGGRRRGR